MLVNPTALEHWMANFYGYGSWDAPIWFIALEEGGGDLPQEVAEKIDYFIAAHPAKTPSLCDIRELYRSASANVDGPRAELYQTLHDYRFGTKAVQHGSWKNLIAFAHSFSGKKVPNLLTYQRESFASPVKKREALIQLYPLPSPHNHAWYYSWLDVPQLPYLRSRAQYQERVYPDRIRTILSKISEHQPKLVLMYGMSNINQLKKSIADEFPFAKFTLSKATKLQLPQYHLAMAGSTPILVTTQIPTLRHQRVETGYDWEYFGNVLRDNLDGNRK